MRIETSTLAKLWPSANPELVKAVAGQSSQVFARYKINTPLRVAHFMAQISHESGGGTIREENLSYKTPQRIADVWPRRFDAESAQAYVRNPKKLACKVYNGRMGNREGTEDGFNYRGRGLLQLTGRESYISVGEALGIDLENEPSLACSPDHSLEIAAYEFMKLRCLAPAERDDIVTVTKRVNGGTTNLSDRRRWLAKWKQALPELPGDPEEIEDQEVTPRGNDSENVPMPPPKPLEKSKTIWGTMLGYFTSLGGVITGFFDRLENPYVFAAFLIIIIAITIFAFLAIKGRVDVQKILVLAAGSQEEE